MKQVLMTMFTFTAGAGGITRVLMNRGRMLREAGIDEVRQGQARPLRHDAAHRPTPHLQGGHARLRHPRQRPLRPVEEDVIEVIRRVVVGAYTDGFTHAGNLAYLSLVTLFPFFIVAWSASSLAKLWPGGWRADLSPVGGPQLGPFRRRSEALRAEAAWLVEHWLVPH